MTDSERNALLAFVYDECGIETVYDTCFGTYSDGEEYIEVRGETGGDVVSGRYTIQDVIDRQVKSRAYGPDRKLDDLNARLYDIEKKIHEFNKKPYYADHKSNFITCRYCGSKLNRKILVENKYTANKCPLCGKDLRPQGELDKLNRLYERRNKLQDDIKTEEKTYISRRKKYDGN